MIFKSVKKTGTYELQNLRINVRVYLMGFLIVFIYPEKISKTSNLGPSTDID